MTLSQFNDLYPNYTGLIFINSRFFVDSKLKNQLDTLKAKYIELQIDNLHNSFFKVFKPNIGANLIYFKNGEFKKQIERIKPIDKLDDFIKSCNEL